MGQEYFINSQNLQDKIANLLPSQGGAGAGFDLSASTQIIPIIDLTESAEGSNLREDLQSSLSFDNITAFNVSNANTTIISNTGYYRIFGVASCFGAGFIQFNITDGATTKTMSQYVGISGTDSNNNFDFIIFLGAGDSISVNATSTSVRATGCSRQIATISGELI